MSSTIDAFEKPSDTKESLLCKIKTEETETTVAKSENFECGCWDLPTGTYSKALNGTSSNACLQRPLLFNLKTKKADDATEEMNKSWKQENNGHCCSCSEAFDPMKEATQSKFRSTEQLELSPDLQDIDLDFRFFQTLDLETFSHIFNDMSVASGCSAGHPAHGFFSL